MTDFESYLKANKEKMMIDTLNPEIWNVIEAKMKLKKHETFNRYLKIFSSLAAIFLFVLVTQFSSNEVEIPEKLRSKYGFKGQNIEAVLNNKLDIIREAQFPISYRENFQKLYNQVKYLDESYRQDLDYLKQGDYDENIAKELMSYYKLKRDILDKIIHEVNRLNSNEKKYQTKSEKSRIVI